MGIEEKWIKIMLCVCDKCGYDWFARIKTTPKQCPRCKTPNWLESKKKPAKFKIEVNQ